ncbi:MAG: hypothetical protein QNL04_05755, partial [SAR324 cluster bacterium]|nr:hypothetical protein [SAR324 cluster bacterium]
TNESVLKTAIELIKESDLPPKKQGGNLKDISITYYENLIKIKNWTISYEELIGHLLAGK